MTPMICDVYQNMKEKEHFLLCEGLHVLNGAYELEIVDGQAEISRERRGEIIWVGQVEYAGDYNASLEAFRQARDNPDSAPHLVRVWCPTCRKHNTDMRFPNRAQAESSSAHLKERGWPTAVVPHALVFKAEQP